MNGKTPTASAKTKIENRLADNRFNRGPYNICAQKTYRIRWSFLIDETKFFFNETRKLVYT